MKKILELEQILRKANQNKLFIKEVTAFGYQYNYNTNVISSISKYWFHDCEIEEIIAPLNSESSNNNRPGTIKESTEYVVVHDTASSAVTADEYAHARYVQNGGGGTSWHYSVGSKMSIHQIPDDEVAYHAGDSLDVRFELTKTNVLGINKNPIVTIIDDYYAFDGVKSNIHIPVVTYVKKNGKLVFASDGVTQGKEVKNPNEEIKLTTEDINDAGIRVDLKEDGYYYIGPTYYNATYKKIANRGGNLNSIGIETMINEGSNLMKTWHRNAKLVAKLLVDNNLDLSRVKPHHFFSGKPCPHTLRYNKLWDYFLECLEIEYTILKDYNDVKIELIDYPKFVDSDGLVNEYSDQAFTYTIKLSYKDYTKEIKLEIN